MIIERITLKDHDHISFSGTGTRKLKDKNFQQKYQSTILNQLGILIQTGI